MKSHRSLPGVRYLLKVEEDKCDVASVTSYVVGRLQERGLRCVVEGRHIVVSAADPVTLLAQAGSATLLIESFYVSSFDSGRRVKVDETTEEF